MRTNEPLTPAPTGTGHHEPDIVGAEIRNDDRSLQFRAKRSGTESGRVYTLEYEVTDASGNASRATATVTVGHDQGHGAPPIRRSH